MIKEIWNILGRRQQVWLIGLLILMLLLPLVELLGVGSIFTFVKAASDPTSLQQTGWFIKTADIIGFDVMNTQEILFWLGLGVFCSIVLRNLILGLNTYVSTKFSSDTISFLSVSLLRSYLYKDYQFHVGNNTAVLAKDVLNEVIGFVSGLFMSVLAIITSTVMICAFCGLMLWYNPVTTGIAMLVLGGGYSGLYMLFRKITHALGKRRLEANSLRFTTVHEALSSYRDATLKNCRMFFIDKYQHASDTLYGVILRTTMMSQLPKHFLEILLFGGIIIMVITSLRQNSFTETITLISLYATAGYRLTPYLDSVFRAFSTMRFNTVVLDMMRRNLTQHARPTSPLNPPSLAFTSHISVCGLFFNYGKRAKALNNINLEIKKRQSVAFVGHTGSGKTTLMNIFLGLLTPATGTILIDDAPLKEDNLSSWQRNIGYVPQDIYLLDNTVRNNIAFGVPEAEIDEEAVILAAKVAHIHDFVVEKLEEGYNTAIGERGVQLSGGQRQRIGIARALYHNPEILVFDEATSSLDKITEEIITQSIKEMKGQRTVIIVAHRISTVKDCDHIYLMDEGKIIDEGCYTELLNRNSIFKKMAS